MTAPNRPALVGELIEYLDIDRSTFYQQVSDGKWERIARGVYLPADMDPVNSDQIEAISRRPEATICLLSALSFYDLTDEVPRGLHVAIPRGTWEPKSEGSIIWHHFDRATFDIGRRQTTIAGTEYQIGIYSPERTIVDAFRLRGQLGYDVALDALKGWLNKGGKPGELIRIARQLPRAMRPLFDALEVLT